jgi:hypothetical protein
MRTIKSDPHHHLRTSGHITPDIVQRSLAKAEERLGKGGILGVINFNPSETEMDQRWDLFRKHVQEKYNSISTGNGLYLPAPDLLIIRGQEIPTQEGYHILLLGTQEDQNITNHSSLEKVLTEGRAFGALIIADHPFHKAGIGPYLQQHPEEYKRFDGYEVFNRTASLPLPGYAQANQKALKEFQEVQIKHMHPTLFAFESTDGHSPSEVGRTYMTIEMSENYETYRDAPEKVIKEMREGYVLSTTFWREFKTHANPGYLGAIKHLFIDLPILIAARKFLGLDPNKQTAPFLEKFGINI